MATQTISTFASARRPLRVPGRGLEPLRIAPPDPKSGASANFATLASEFFCAGNNLEQKRFAARVREKSCANSMTKSRPGFHAQAPELILFHERDPGA